MAGEERTALPVLNSQRTVTGFLALAGSGLVALGLDAEGLTDSFFPHPTNATTAIIKRICFMPATLRHNGTGVNAVGGERQEEVGINQF
jgi:hypothetical protein